MEKSNNNNEMNFWASKGQDNSCQGGCNDCDCNKSKCVDDALVDFEEDVRNGLVEKDVLDECILIKQYTLFLLKDTPAAENLAIEVAWLRMMREKQYGV